MILRIANENDYDSVHELMYQIFEKHLLRRPDIYKEGNPFSVEQFKASLEDSNDIIILAENEQVVVGLCHMVKREIGEIPMLRPGCIAFIEDFCVHKEYQRRGLGRVLYEEAVKRAEIWQADSLELNVWEVNGEARKFYDAVGFKPKSTRMELKLK